MQYSAAPFARSTVTRCTTTVTNEPRGPHSGVILGHARYLIAPPPLAHAAVPTPAPPPSPRSPRRRPRPVESMAVPGREAPTPRAAKLAALILVPVVVLMLSRTLSAPNYDSPNVELRNRLYRGLVEHDATIAFFLQVSVGNLPLLPRLLLKLWHKDNLYAVHFDQKVPAEEVQRFVKELRSDARYANVHIMAPEPVTYMGVTMLLNTLSAMQRLLDEGADWDYFINLSGSDYPLVDVANQMRLLGQPGASERGTNFVHLTPGTHVWEKTEKSRLGFMHFDTALGFRSDINHTVIKSWKEHPLFQDHLGVRLVKGEAWVIAHRSLCEFAVKSSYARRLLLLMANMQDPEEHFFQTLVWNHNEFNKTLARHSLRQVHWSFNGTRASQHPFMVDMTQDGGEWSFWPMLENNPTFYTRKFGRPNSMLMERIDRLKSGTHPKAHEGRVIKSFDLASRHFNCLLDLKAQSLLHPDDAPCKKF